MTTDNESGDLVLFVMRGLWGLPSLSPFGLKLATWLRMAGIPHELRFEDDPRKGPKKKSPWVVDAGRTIGDSAFIIDHLERTRGVAPDAGLNPQERAVSLTLRRTFEEHFHQIVEYALFTTDEGWREIQPHFSFMPPPLRAEPILRLLLRRLIAKAHYIRGLGRHTEEEMASLAALDLEAAATLLGDRPFFFGAQPTTLDCTMYGFLALTLWPPIPYFGQTELLRHKNLVAFCERMRDRYWTEEAREGKWQPSTGTSDDGKVDSPKAAPEADASAPARFEHRA